jgi:hypothetical protein
MKHAWIVAAAAAVITSVAMAAGAWEIKSPFDATVNGHQFSEIQMSNQDCVLSVKLAFDAPAEKYQSGASARNHYRFQARLELADNITVDSPVFFNRSAGKRIYEFKKDTAVGGCWAKEKLKLQGVDVQGCRGAGCRVPPHD